jgi:DNA-binding transcriptional MerR regulator
MLKDTFQIKDLENLTGVKIPTLRIWEKRYDILKPTRTSTGIRFYTIEEVAKILNVVYLNRNGWKISKIAQLSVKEMQLVVRNLDQTTSDYPMEVEQFLISMLQFDTLKFNEIYSQIRKLNSFSKVYETYLIPLLKRIGVLWQTDTIDVVHEHFISSLISQKLIFEIENLSLSLKKDKTYILFLPENEMHEIGLRYLQYQLLKNNKQTLYLGNHVAIKHLDRFKDRKDVVLIGNLTISPNEKSLANYLQELDDFSAETKLPIYLYGLQFSIHTLNVTKYPSISIYHSPMDLLENMI